jgi:small multidrug resistance pump
MGVQRACRRPVHPQPACENRGRFGQTIESKPLSFQLPAPSISQAWMLLALAISFEIGGTVCLRLSQGFANLVPTLLIFVFYGISFAINAMVVRTLDLSVTYAVWSGVGTAVTAMIGFWYFKEPATALKLASIGLIVVGVIGLHSASRMPA